MSAAAGRGREGGPSHLGLGNGERGSHWTPPAARQPVSASRWLRFKHMFEVDPLFGMKCIPERTPLFSLFIATKWDTIELYFLTGNGILSMKQSPGYAAAALIRIACPPLCGDYRIWAPYLHRHPRARPRPSIHVNGIWSMVELQQAINPTATRHRAAAAPDRRHPPSSYRLSYSHEEDGKSLSRWRGPVFESLLHFPFHLSLHLSAINA